MSFNLENFFEFYAGEVQQREGVSLLAQSMPSSLMTGKAAWSGTQSELPQQQTEALSTRLTSNTGCQLNNPSGEG